MWHYFTKCLKHGSWVFTHQISTHTTEFGKAKVKHILKKDPQASEEII